MGLREAIDQVIAKVQATTPTTDTAMPFRVQDDGEGACVRLEDAADTGIASTRLCDVRLTGFPADDGVASASALRFRADLAVRVFYLVGTQRTQVEKLMGEDAAAILTTLADPSNWDAGTTGIGALVVAASRPSAALIAEDAGAILTIPFTAIYRE